jgi:hypothetical protein
LIRVKKDMNKLKWLACGIVVAALMGCDQPIPPNPEPTVPSEQKVVMVPSWKDGQPAKPSDGKDAGDAPGLAPGSTPDAPQPGDSDYKGAQ